MPPASAITWFLVKDHVERTVQCLSIGKIGWNEQCGPDQTAPKEQSDQGQHCLLIFASFGGILHVSVLERLEILDFYPDF